MRSDGRKRSAILEQARLDQFCAAVIEVIAAAPHRDPSLSAIATAAGVSKGLILYHVDSRDDLLRRCFERIDQLLGARVEADIAAMAEQTPWTILATIVRSILAFMAEDRARCVAHSRLYDLTLDTSPPTDDTPTEYDPRDPDFVQLARYGIDGGLFRDVVPLHLSAVVNGSVDSFLDRWTRDPSFDLVAAGEYLLDLLAHGLLRKDSR